MQDRSRDFHAPELIGIGDDAPFELRLAQALAWCKSRTLMDDPRAMLRSEQLRPRLLEVDRTTAVRHVVSYRGTLVGETRLVERSADFEGGRLLVYFPDEDLACGAAEVATRGFFDVNNVPPWDTWLGPFRDAEVRSGVDYVVSWVPGPLVKLAARGIDVNPEGCIAWLKDGDTRVAKILSTHGIIA